MTDKRSTKRSVFATGDGHEIAIATFVPEGTPIATVVVPPLIGGSYAMHLRQFSALTRAGFRVASFNYRGHGKSTGQFDVLSALRDTSDVCMHLKEAHPATPLVGIGMCFGSMPLLYAVAKNPNLFDRLVFINGIRHLRETSGPVTAAGIYLRSRQWPKPVKPLGALTVILDELMPTIDKSPSFFGILDYDRVNKMRTALQYFLYRTPRAAARPAVPTLVCYGKNDKLLRLDNSERSDQYENSFRELFSNVAFLPLQTDHYMNGIHGQLAGRIVRFLSAGKGARLHTSFAASQTASNRKSGASPSRYSAANL